MYPESNLAIWPPNNNTYGKIVMTMTKNIPATMVIAALDTEKLET